MTKKVQKFGWVILVLAAMVAGSVIAWHAAYPSTTVKYKMTVTVDTPDGLKTGSAVREVLIFREPEIMGQPGGHAVINYGEAVVVDLEKRGALFALLKGKNGSHDYAHNIFFKAFPCPYGGGATKKCIQYYQTLKESPTIKLTVDQYPAFVSFSDSNDPKTVQPLLEEKVCDPSDSDCVEVDLLEGGVKLKSVVMEIVRDPVTVKVKDYMPPYGEGTGFSTWFKSLKYGDARAVGPDSFIRGARQ